MVERNKIERYYRSIKNVFKLENYFFPDELRERIGEFVQYYNFHKYHKALENPCPADVYFQRGKEILKQREITKTKTLEIRRSLYEKAKINA